MADPEKESSQVRLRQAHDGRVFTLPIQPQPFRRLLYAVWLGVWLITEGVLVAGLSGWNSLETLSHDTLVSMLVLFSAAGAFIVWRLLWTCFGREVFTVTDDELVVRRELLGIGRSISVPLQLLHRVRVGKLAYRAIYPSWGRAFIGRGDSEILVPTGEVQVAYGRGLEEGEAVTLVDKINEEVHLRKVAKEDAKTRVGGL